MPTEASKAAARDGRWPCNLGGQGCAKAEGYNVSCVEAAPKKSGENDNIRFELWRKCVEKLGSGLRAADKRRLCTVETYPSASATTTFQPQGGGERAPINTHPRRWSDRHDVSRGRTSRGCVLRERRVLSEYCPVAVQQTKEGASRAGVVRG